MRQRCGATLECRDPLFQRILRGIHDARVDIAQFAQREEIGRMLGAFKYVGSRPVHRQGARLCDRVGGHARMQAHGLEFH